MIVMAMLLLAAAPANHHVRARHHPVRVVRVVRPARKMRRPISLSARKLRSDDCGTGSICVTAMSQTRYRLPLPSTPEPTAKDMALAEDGTRCALIGQTICTHPARTIVRIGEPAPGVPADAVIR